MPKDVTKYNRREMLSAACVTALIGGCAPTADQSDKPAVVTRTDVPLRILWVGNQSDIDVVNRAWGSVMEQPLKFDLVEFDRSSPSGVIGQITAKAKKNDLVVYPICAAAELRLADAVLPLSQKEIDEVEKRLGRIYPAVKNGAARFGADRVATPIGALLPALLSIDEVEKKIESWRDYHDWVKDDLGGAASEPLANGWAGASFLWRAASTVTQGWLFGRENMQPLVDGDEFVVCLEQMTETVKQYKSDLQAPQQIWSALQSGGLRGAIGFEVPNDESAGEINVSNCPGTGDASKILLDPFSMVVSVSAGCRQSTASKQWMNWLSGGDGSETVRRQVDSVTITRTKADVDVIETQQQSSSSYERWLRERLDVSLQLPTLRLIKADEYYSELDRQVVKCIRGGSKAGDAMKAVAESWQDLNSQVGVEKQQRAWRRSQGLGR